MYGGKGGNLYGNAGATQSWKTSVKSRGKTTVPGASGGWRAGLADYDTGIVIKPSNKAYVITKNKGTTAGKASMFKHPK